MPRVEGSVTWATLWVFLHAVAWSVYLGGALAMELVWRPAQAHLPMSQIGEACQAMGRRYRWVALSMLAAIAVTGAARLPDRAPRYTLSLSSGYGRTLLALVIGWVVLVLLVSLMGAVAHPALHVRMPSHLEPEARAAAREEVARAIRRMDTVLRIELVVALLVALLGASLPAGGLL